MFLFMSNKNYDVIKVLTDGPSSGVLFQLFWLFTIGSQFQV